MTSRTSFRKSGSSLPVGTPSSSIPAGERGGSGDIVRKYRKDGVVLVLGQCWISTSEGIVFNALSMSRHYKDYSVFKDQMKDPGLCADPSHYVDPPSRGAGPSRTVMNHEIGRFVPSVGFPTVTILIWR
jgi:hypothetical protein